MARAVDRIEQDLAALEEAIAFLKAEFHNSYSQYLKLLGKAVRQQLILAGYQVCTQGYPESFLSLSFSQRQNLQQAIRKRGEQVQEDLLSHLQSLTRLPETGGTDIVEETASSEDEQTQEANQEQLPQLLEMPISKNSPANTLDSADQQLSQPEQLQEWQEQLEEAIAQTLQNLSLDSNRLLQTSGIIPHKLPPAVLEAAIQVEASAESTVGSPNLLNLLMEAESEDETEDSNLMRVIAINLRLPEIEFGDPTLSAARNQIRKLSARLNTLQREYHKKQRERAVAQAEAAWRSSWFDE
jgi:hypothetical protein